MITTKKLGATNTKGARIVATGGGHKVTIPYPHELNTFDAHLSAARVIAQSMGWNQMTFCDSPDRKGFAFMSTTFAVPVDGGENPT